jgi:hypothetical protein
LASDRRRHRVKKIVDILLVEGLTVSIMKLSYSDVGSERLDTSADGLRTVSTSFRYLIVLTNRGRNIIGGGNKTRPISVVASQQLGERGEITTRLAPFTTSPRRVGTITGVPSLINITW